MYPAKRRSIKNEINNYALALGGTADLFCDDGENVDTENDGQPTAEADGDDKDEEGMFLKI